MNKIIVSVSGGKDSAICFHKAINEYGKENVIGIFCDTKWESEKTYEYIEYLKQFGNLIAVSNPKYPNGLLDMIKHYKKFPTALMRFCTRELKLVPFQNYLIENKLLTNTEIWLGIRLDESRNRYERYKQYKSNDYLKYQDINKNCKKAIRYIPTRLPIVDMKTNEVYKYFVDNNFENNPLYSHLNIDRVGCFPCILAGMRHWRNINQCEEGKRNIDMLIALEKEFNIKINNKIDIKTILESESMQTWLNFECDNEGAFCG